METVNWYVGTYAEDMQRTFERPGPGEGDGRVYIIQDVFGDYLIHEFESGGLATGSRRDKAKLYYDGQAAWGAARKSIYPAMPVIIGNDKAMKPEKPVSSPKRKAKAKKKPAFRRKPAPAP